MNLMNGPAPNSIVIAVIPNHTILPPNFFIGPDFHQQDAERESAPLHPLR